MVKTQPEVARLGAVHRTLPTTRATLSVTTSSATASLAAYAGKWIWLKALTVDITILRRSVTLTTSTGFILKTTDPYLEVFVDPGGDLNLSHIAGSATTLEILYDNE